MDGWSIARRLLLAHCVFISVLTVLVGTAVYVDARDRGYSAMADRMMSVAVSIADSPLVVTAAQSSDPTAALQSYTLAVSEQADVDTLSIMSPSGVRWTHPDATQIGDVQTLGTARAAAGASFTEVTSGDRGPMVRAVVPILDPDATVVGIVAAGVETSTVQTVLDARLPAVLALALTLILAGSVAIWFLGRYLNRVTLGWGPEALARNFLLNDSVLHSVRDGLLLVDRKGDLVYYNDQAARLLGLPPRHGPRGGPRSPTIARLDLPAGLSELLRSGRPVQDEVFRTDTRVLVVTQEPAMPSPTRVRNRAALRTLVTIRDHTDVDLEPEPTRPSTPLSSET
ncbi:PAS domain-containing protein [Cryobacterium sp. AP23]